MRVRAAGVAVLGALITGNVAQAAELFAANATGKKKIIISSQPP